LGRIPEGESWKDEGGPASVLIIQLIQHVAQDIVGKTEAAPINSERISFSFLISTKFLT
jgi:hypothetical protein